MAARPTWQGHLRLSLVSCPVALYTATNGSSDISFHLLNPKTNNRIRMVPTDPDTGPVERSSLVKGYEVDKDRYILLDADDLASVKLESTKTLDIERFVDVDAIDRLYWNDPYFLVPDGKVAAEPYAVIREAMQKAGKIALGRVVLHTRERLLALEPREDGIVAWSLRTADEVRDVNAAFDDIPSVKTDPKMIDIAGKIIDQLEGPFDPSTFNDRYEEALKALIAAKEEGHKPVAAPEVEDTKVSDLMDALRKSLGQATGTKSEPAKRKAAPAAKARRAAPAKTARRKAG